MLIQGQIGQAVGADGTNNNLRQSRTSELIVSQNHARYYETASRGNIFNLTLSAAVGGVVAGNLVGAAANAATQFAIWNPLGSGFNMSILKTNIGIISGTVVGGPIFHGVFVLGNPTNAITFDAGRAAQNCTNWWTSTSGTLYQYCHYRYYNYWRYYTIDSQANECTVFCRYIRSPSWFTNARSS
jgi:hypothetical protein